MKKNKFSALKVIKNTCTVIVLTVMFILVFQSIRLRNNKEYIPPVFGKTYLNVLSKSMEPEFNEKDLIFGQVVKDVSSLNIGDIITYKDNNILVTHRIQAIEGDHKAFITKGDKNDSVDVNSVKPEQVVSKYINKIPKLGTLVAKFQDFKFLVLIWIIFMYFILKELYNEYKILRSSNKKDRDITENTQAI